MNILLGIAIGLSLLLLLWLVDIAMAKQTAVVGLVLGRRRVAKHQSMIMVGKVFVPTVTPEQFILSVQGKRGPIRISTDAATYASVADGEQIGYIEKRGLFTGLVYSRATPKPKAANV